MLLVKLRKLVEVIKVCASTFTKFSRVDLYACRAVRASYLLPQNSAPGASFENGISVGMLANQPLAMATRSMDVIAYFSVNGEAWRPRFRRDDLANAVLPSLGCYLANVFHGVFKFLFRRSKGGRILQSMRPYPLIGLSYRQRMASPLDG